MEEKKPIRSHQHRHLNEKKTETKKKKRLTESEVQEKYPILAEIFEGL